MKNSYIITGDNDYLKDNKLNELINNFDGDIEIYDELESFNDLIIHSNTMGLFATRKVIIVKDPRIFKDDKGFSAFKEYLKNENENTLIIFFCKEKLDKRKKVIKELLKEVQNLEFNMLKNYELERFVKEELFKINLNLDQEGILFFIEAVGNNQRMIMEEIKKLEIYDFTKKNLVFEDIKNIITSNISSNIFNLTDGITSKNKTKTMSAYKNLKILKETDYMIIFMLIKHFKQMVKIKFMEKNRKTEGDIIKTLKIHPFIYKKIKENLRKFSLNDLLRSLEELYNLDYEVKSIGDNNLSQRLEIFLLNL